MDPLASIFIFILLLANLVFTVFDLAATRERLKELKRLNAQSEQLIELHKRLFPEPVENDTN